MIETLGLRLKKLRERDNINQSRLAEILSISKSTLSLYESDERQPPIGTLIRIAGLFSVSTDYLIGIEKEQKVNTSGLSPSEIMLLNQIADWMRKEHDSSNVFGNRFRQGGNYE